MNSVLYFETSEEKIKQVLTKHKVQFTQDIVEKIKRNSLGLEEYLRLHELGVHKMKNEEEGQRMINYMI